MQRDVGVMLEGGTPAWVDALNDGALQPTDAAVISQP
jgi:hypothetical protein